jgi:hypothetical protein
MRVAEQVGLQYQNAIRGSEGAMRRWLGGIAAFLLCAGTAAAAGPDDCSAAPDVKCLAAEVFALAKTRPADDFYRRHVAFAEQELAPGDIVTALGYVVTDNPDAPPWEDLYWIAKAGRFDLAVKQARQRKSPVERLGGLISVAGFMLDRNDAARAQKIVEEVERQLPSISGDDEATSFPRDTGELWVRLGQVDRGVRLIAGAGIDSVSRLLSIAVKHPAAARLREQAWREAERVKEPYAWKLLVEDALQRGDQADASRAAQDASRALAGAIDGDHVPQAISLARVALTAGLPESAASIIKPWTQWVRAQEAPRATGIVTDLMPVLAGLGQDQDVLSAARLVNDVAQRSQCLSAAAIEYFRIGRLDIAEQRDAEALALAVSSPVGDPKLQWSHDASLQNLALERAGHGDIQGAFAVVASIRDEAKVRAVMSYVVRRAIDNGHTPVVGPAIEAMQELAIAAQDAPLLLEAAERWYTVGSENKARSSFAQAMKLVDAGQAKLTGEDAGLAAELAWRLDAAGRPEALFDIAEKWGVNDERTIDHLVEIVKPVSPAVAVQLANRQPDVVRRIDALAGIALRIATGAK